MRRESRRHVAITGVGVVSALGATARETWESLLAGRVGIGPVTLFDTSRDRTHLAAEIPAFDPQPLLAEEALGLSPRDLRRGSRGDLIGLTAALEAVHDAGWEPGDRRLDGGGVLLGGGAGSLLQAEDYLRLGLLGRTPPP